MTNLVFLIPAALFLGGISLLAFLWALRSGQYEDMDGAAERVLLDDLDDRPSDGPSGKPLGANRSGDDKDSTLSK